MIEIENLSVVLSGQTILDGINLTIKKNKRTVIVGESGSGKSVLVKCIIGLLKPTFGKITIEGMELGKIKGKSVFEVRKNLSMLFKVLLFWTLLMYIKI